MKNVVEIQPIGIIGAISLYGRTLSAVLLLAGLILCLGSAFGLTRVLCLTGGCQLYQDYSFLGLSLHIWGALAFGFGLVILVCSSAHYRRFLAVCLWAEIALLTYQVVYLPCSECLLVGLIWGLLALLEMRERVPVKIWSAVFLAALVLMGQDLMHPWPVYGHADAPLKVYFSPSCKACRVEIEKLLGSGEVARDKVAFYPVALKGDDFDRVFSLQSVLNRTLDLEQAFQASWSAGDIQLPENWRNWLMIKFGMIRNRMILARMGVEKIPLVVSGSLASVTGDSAGECGFEEGKDCPDKDKIANTLKVFRGAESKIAALKKVQLLEGDAPETAETLPQVIAPPTETPEPTDQQTPALEQQSQAPKIQVFTQEKSPETETSPQPDEDVERSGDDDMVKLHFRPNPGE